MHPPTSQAAAEPGEVIGYGAWGEAFFATAVTVDRVLSGVAVMSGRPVEVGPIGVGPGRLAKARARGSVGTPTGHRVSTKPARFEVDLPVDVDLRLDLGVDTHCFSAAIVVPLHLTAHAREDLSIVLDVRPPQPDELRVRLRATTRRATIVQHAANVEGELRRFVADYVAVEIDQPHVLAARVIDVAGALDGAFAAIAAARPVPPPVRSTGAASTAGPPAAGPVGGVAVAAEPAP